MKKIFTLFLACMFSAGLIAQPSLTYQNFSKTLDTGMFVVRCTPNDTTVFNNIKNIEGNNVVWDASALSTANISDSYWLDTCRFVSVASTAYADTFRNANHSLKVITGWSYSYYNISTSSIEYLGEYKPDNSYLTYSNGDVNMKFPLAYGEEFTDAFANKKKYNFLDPGTLNSGTRIAKYVGYGTLKLPNYTHTNVAYVKSTKTYNTGYVAQDYWWYDVSTGRILLTNRRDTIFENYGMTDLKTVYNQNCFFFTNVPTENPSTTIDNVNNNDESLIEVLGNGTNNIVLNSSFADNVICTIVDINGKEICKLTLVRGQQTSALQPGNGITSGLYFAKIYSKDKVQTYKLLYIQQ